MSDARNTDRKSSGEQQVVLLRLGEVFLKGDNRPFFLSKLRRSVEHAMSGFATARLETRHDRMRIWHEEPDLAPLLKRLGQVFGLSSFSPAVRVEPKLEVIADKALELARNAIAERSPRSFKVSAHRADKRFSHTSPEIGRLVGARIYEDTGLSVDLHHPDLLVEVDVTREHAFVWTDRVPGAGGLPSGSSGRVTLLLSGGIDSPVAGWLLAKRGVQLSAVTFQSPPYTGPEAMEKVVTLTRLLASWAGPIRLYDVRFTEAQKLLRSAKPAEMAVVLYRRTMMRVASRIARREKARALATGESLGQVASQTLENLAAIQDTSDLPVLRPLLGYDKVETIALARRIGTYETSILPHQDMCSLFIPKHPVTKARIDRCIQAETGLDRDLDDLSEQLARDAGFRIVEA